MEPTVVNPGDGQPMPDRDRSERHRRADQIRRLVEYLKRCWSRFLYRSEVSAINWVAGRITVVSDITYKLIANAVRAHERTAAGSTR